MTERDYALQVAKSWTEAIADDPDNADNYFRRGGAYLDCEDFDAAIADYSSAIDLKPGDSVAYNNRGIAHRGKGETELAIADYRAALAKTPTEEDRQELETALKRLSDAP